VGCWLGWGCDLKIPKVTLLLFWMLFDAVVAVKNFFFFLRHAVDFDVCSRAWLWCGRAVGLLCPSTTCLSCPSVNKDKPSLDLKRVRLSKLLFLLQ
jgi:hypothetical protein